MRRRLFFVPINLWLASTLLPFALCHAVASLLSSQCLHTSKIGYNASDTISMKSNILTFGLSSVAMLASSYSLMAADADLVDSPDPVESTDILEILWMGGFMMYPLAVLSVICVVLILVLFFHDSSQFRGE